MTTIRLPRQHKQSIDLCGKKAELNLAMAEPRNSAYCSVISSSIDNLRTATCLEVVEARMQIADA